MRLDAGQPPPVSIPGVSLGNGQQFNVVNPGQAYGATGWGIVSPVLTAQHIQLLQQSYPDGAASNDDQWSEWHLAA